MTREAGDDTVVAVRTGDVVAFRLHSHHLDRRQPVESLDQVTGACGIQNSPPGSALLALHARLADVTPDLVDHLLAEKKSLLQTWCMRGAPFCFPTGDAPVFTTGVLPTTQEARLHLIVGIEYALGRLGMGLDEAVDVVAREITAVLSGRRLAIRELGQELAERAAATLTPARRRAWQEPGPYGVDQPLGEAVVHFCVRILALRGVVCLAPRRQNTAPFVLVEEWLGRPMPRVRPESARATLLRRYLHCYGPSTRADFAAWVGVRAGDVDPWWTAIEDEMTPVEVDGHRAWILTDDVDALRSPPRPRGVRLLPPHDPYTQMRDRATIVDASRRRAVWKAVGAPGVVLADGEVAGIWRPRKAGRRLTLTVELFRSPDPGLRGQLRDEAGRLGKLRGASVAEVEFDGAAR